MERRKTVNHEFFSEWSEEMAWALGFWAADGCAKEKHIISFSQKERYILERIRSLLHSDHKISEEKIGGKSYYSLSYTSKSQYEALCYLFDMNVYRKSKTLSFPRTSSAYRVPFIRGFVDGDGCLDIRPTGYPRIHISCGSKRFAHRLVKVVEEQTGIIGTCSKDKRCPGFTTVSFDGIKGVCLAYWLYIERPGIGLGRKRQLAERFLAWNPKHIKGNSVTSKMLLMYPHVLKDIPIHGKVQQ